MGYFLLFVAPHSKWALVRNSSYKKKANKFDLHKKWGMGIAPVEKIVLIKLYYT